MIIVGWVKRKRNPTKQNRGIVGGVGRMSYDTVGWVKRERNPTNTESDLYKDIDIIYSQEKLCGYNISSADALSVGFILTDKLR